MRSIVRMLGVILMLASLEGTAQDLTQGNKFFQEGMTHLFNGGLANAEKLFKSARKTYTQSENNRKANECLIGLGLVSFQQRRMQEAREYFEEALKYHKLYYALDVEGEKLIEQNLMLCKTSSNEQENQKNK